MKLKVTILAVFFLIFFLLFLFIKPYYEFLTKKLKVSPIKTLLSLDSLKSYNNQVAIVILGIAGQNYEGPNLSDSIMVAFYNLKQNRLTTVSIPRDVWSDTLKDKINTAYAYGESKQKGGGFKLAKAEVGAIVGLPIQYAAVIDFDRFTEFIDLVDGVDIDVDRSFTDLDFPIPGRENDLCEGDKNYRCRYQTVSFQKGPQHMNGKIALTFIRSRRAQGPEGSDFARNARELKVMQALKGNILNTLKSGNLSKTEKIYNVFNDLVSRDITNQQLAILAKKMILGKNFAQKDSRLSEDFFIVPDYSKYEGKYVLIPQNEDYSAIHSYVLCQLKNSTDCEKLTHSTLLRVNPE